ncbi:MAG TPA: SprT family zinc-dependent metalloprotease [Clostridiales bacterium]|nr:SprT family zinc-dependent metalloprotease [Clostridiales bacterium]
MQNNKYFFEIDNNKITYITVKSKRKTIGITVDRNGEVKISAPLNISEKGIGEVVRKKAGWIIQKVNEARKRNSNLVSKEFIDGEKFLYLGENYSLKVVERNFNKPEAIMQDDIIEVHILQGLSGESRKQVIKETLINWYKQRFAKVAKERIEKYSLQLKTTPCKVVIKNQKTRWGSCSTKGNINLNWRLVMAPIGIIDYVVVHEMCHLRVMNHSKDFWNLVESVLPNYTESREWLKVNGSRLSIEEYMNDFDVIV